VGTTPGTASMTCIDLASFQEVAGVLEDSAWYFVVKSLDQVERRTRLVSSRKGNKFGRIQARPTAEGILSLGVLKSGRIDEEWRKSFREPRHIRSFRRGEFLLAEMNRLLRIDPQGQVLQSYTHPYFGFLHTVDLHPRMNRALVVSSGYDCALEIDLEEGKETHRWVAWDHGFNPDEEGVWLAADRARYEEHLAKGRRALLIDPLDYGEQGLVTARRSAHPNAGVYNCFREGQTIILSMGHNGNLLEISLEEGTTRKVFDQLDQMPHGIIPRREGWVVTNTTKGEWWTFSPSFESRQCYSVAKMGGKVPGTESVEWVQQVIPVGESKALFLDANRGLIAVDIFSRCYSIYQPDPNWCIQDALPCG
jgi:hypothetical protein